MKLRVTGFALALMASTLAYVATTNARETKQVRTKEECMADCQVGFIKCNQTGKGRNGETCDRTCCQELLGDCQRDLCSVLPVQ